MIKSYVVCSQKCIHIVFCTSIQQCNREKLEIQGITHKTTFGHFDFSDNLKQYICINKVCQCINGFFIAAVENIYNLHVWIKNVKNLSIHKSLQKI